MSGCPTTMPGRKCDKYCPSPSTYVSAFGFVGFILSNLAYISFYVFFFIFKFARIMWYTSIWCVYSFLCPSIFRGLFLLHLAFSIYLFFFLSIFVSIYLSIYLPIHLSISIWTYLYLFVLPFFLELYFIFMIHYNTTTFLYFFRSLSRSRCVSLSLCFPTAVSICISMYLSMPICPYLPQYLYLGLYACFQIWTSFYLYLCLIILCLSLCLSLSLSVYFPCSTIFQT